jgi:hypothetical protein
MPPRGFDYGRCGRFDMCRRNDGGDICEGIGVPKLYDDHLLSGISGEFCPNRNFNGAHQMIVRRFLANRKGGVALEFGLTAPAFFALVIGAMEVGLLCWAQLALQQGTEAAARCATVNKTLCGTAAQIKSYASAQSFGLAPPTSTFTVTAAGCGNQVQASLNPQFLTGFAMPAVTLTASACFPA